MNLRSLNVKSYSCVIVIIIVFSRCFKRFDRISFRINNEIPPIYFENEISWAHCHLCSFSPSNTNSNSSPTDAILAIHGKSMTGLHVFIRTLRTTRTLARVFVFISNDLIETVKSQALFFAQCGVFIIYDLQDAIPCRHYHALRRFQLWALFLHQHHEINRVLITDTSDVVFQGDPFTHAINEGYIYLFCEGATIGQLPPNFDWIVKSSDRSAIPYTITEECALNGGTIIGGRGPIITLFDELVKKIEIAGFPCDFGFDQAILNLMYYNGKMRRLKIPVQIISSRDNIFFRVDHKFKSNISGTLGTLSNPNSLTPFKHVHGYHRLKIFTESVDHYCPPLGLRGEQLRVD